MNNLQMEKPIPSYNTITHTRGFCSMFTSTCPYIYCMFVCVMLTLHKREIVLFQLCFLMTPTEGRDMQQRLKWVKRLKCLTCLTHEEVKENKENVSMLGINLVNLIQIRDYSCNIFYSWTNNAMLVTKHVVQFIFLVGTKHVIQFIFYGSNIIYRGKNMLENESENTNTLIIKRTFRYLNDHVTLLSIINISILCMCSTSWENLPKALSYSNENESNKLDTCRNVQKLQS